MSQLTKRQILDTLTKELKRERQSFESQWRSISDYTLPSRARFTLSRTNRGDRRNQKIINSTAVLASRTLRSGMVAGITSPARPWYKLAIKDRDLMEYGPVKYWLQNTENEMRSQFLVSNLYNILPTLYGDLGNFATGCIFMEEDFETVSRFYVFPIGSYWIANDERLKVKIFYREFRFTVRQIVEKFGRKDATGSYDWSNISSQVKNLYNRSQYETWIDMCHIVIPNISYDPNKLLSKYKKYSSIYYEKGTGNNDKADMDKYLSEKGYTYFPVLAPRWEKTGEDVYGTDCPGMTAFGDNKSLQTMEKREAQAIEKLINPPMTGPSILRNKKASILPGDMTYLDLREGQQGFKPVHEVKPDIASIEMKIEKQERRISRAYYENLFLMLSQSDRREITAREVDERHEEKLLMLGPVLEGLNEDLLDPLIDNQFAFGEEQGRFLPPPPELSGMPLKVEYVSIMAQAQKLAGIANIERFFGFVINTAVQSQNFQMLQKIDFDQAVDVYGERMGIDVDLIKTDEDVQVIREQEAKAAQEQATMDQITQGASAAKDLAKSDLKGNNALKKVVEGIGGNQ